MDPGGQPPDESGPPPPPPPPAREARTAGPAAPTLQDAVRFLVTEGRYRLCFGKVGGRSTAVVQQRAFFKELVPACFHLGVPYAGTKGEEEQAKALLKALGVEAHRKYSQAGSTKTLRNVFINLLDTATAAPSTSGLPAGAAAAAPQTPMDVAELPAPALAASAPTPSAVPGPPFTMQAAAAAGPNPLLCLAPQHDPARAFGAAAASSLGSHAPRPSFPGFIGGASAVGSNPRLLPPPPFMPMAIPTGPRPLGLQPGSLAPATPLAAPGFARSAVRSASSMPMSFSPLAPPATTTTGRDAPGRGVRVGRRRLGTDLEGEDEDEDEEEDEEEDDDEDEDEDDDENEEDEEDEAAAAASTSGTTAARKRPCSVAASTLVSKRRAPGQLLPGVIAAPVFAASCQNATPAAPTEPKVASGLRLFVRDYTYNPKRPRLDLEEAGYTHAYIFILTPGKKKKTYKAVYRNYCHFMEGVKKHDACLVLGLVSPTPLTMHLQAEVRARLEEYAAACPRFLEHELLPIVACAPVDKREEALELVTQHIKDLTTVRPTTRAAREPLFVLEPDQRFIYWEGDERLTKPVARGLAVIDHGTPSVGSLQVLLRATLDEVSTPGLNFRLHAANVDEDVVASANMALVLSVLRQDAFAHYLHTAQPQDPRVQVAGAAQGTVRRITLDVYPPHVPLTGRSLGLAALATTAATLLQLELPDRTYILGDLSFSGRVQAVGGLRVKLAKAAWYAKQHGWDWVNVLLPAANVKAVPGGGEVVVEADGREVWLSADEERGRLRIIPVALDLDAMRILFNEDKSVPPNLGQDPVVEQVANQVALPNQHAENPWGQRGCAYAACCALLDGDFVRVQADMARLSRLPHEPAKIVVLGAVGNSDCLVSGLDELRDQGNRLQEFTRLYLERGAVTRRSDQLAGELAALSAELGQLGLVPIHHPHYHQAQQQIQERRLQIQALQGQSAAVQAELRQLSAREQDHARVFLEGPPTTKSSRVTAIRVTNARAPQLQTRWQALQAQHPHLAGHDFDAAALFDCYVNFGTAGQQVTAEAGLALAAHQIAWRLGVEIPQDFVFIGEVSCGGYFFSQAGGLRQSFEPTLEGLVALKRAGARVIVTTDQVRAGILARVNDHPEELAGIECPEVENRLEALLDIFVGMIQ